MSRHQFWLLILGIVDTVWCHRLEKERELRENEYVIELKSWLTMLWILTTAARRLSCWAVSSCPCCIASLVWMPFSLTVITEVQITAFTFTSESGTRSTPGCDNSVATVRCWTPAGVWIGEENASHHKVFVFGYHIGLCFEQELDVGWMHRFSALRASDISSRLGDLDGQITLEADPACRVLTREHREHVIRLIIFHVTQLTLLWVLRWLLSADGWCLVTALRRSCLLHEDEGNAINVTRRRAGTLRCGVVVIVLKDWIINR